ncbi:sigma-70 family RNA polymerase sigma factor [Clostridium sp. YIM B02506]|uniref:sigma-70 family RNA polymerase sigma factor n=1 Tax=Clostridium sp. YIM B02506 TaxID=2910680 RepID=UPI001EEEDE0B|nr:sigma-70 family RNA polymerase sigma factor [Clostridium sp. YIM B02506]
MKISKDNLLPQLKSKNPKALDLLVDVYGSLLYKVIYNVIGSYGDTEIVEECLNDVLLNIWNNINKFSGEESKFPKWICVIAKYKAIDYQRKLSKAKKTTDIDDCVLISDLSVEEELISEENSTELLKYIDLMEPLDKKIFITRYFLDESINNIAKSLNLARGSVDSRLSRGRRFLKLKLQANSKEEYNNGKQPVRVL